MPTSAKTRRPLRMDPTRTLTLRRKWERDFVRRFNRLKKAIMDLVSKEDAFGLGRKPLVIHEEVNDAIRLVSNGGIGRIGGNAATAGRCSSIAADQVTREENDDVRGAKSETGRDGNGRLPLLWGGTTLGRPIADDDDAGNHSPPVANQRFRFLTTPQQVQAYDQWLRQQAQLQVIASELGNVEQAYWNAYVKEAYLKGAGRAFDDANKPYARGYGEAGAPVSDFYRGTRYEFLRSSFAQPVSIEKVKLLAGRVFTDLKGVTEAMATQMSRTLTDGLAQGKSPLVMARDLVKTVNDVGIKRARVIARTETIRAHAEGQLDSLERMGVTHVGVMVEWSTTGDDLVCELCASMSGVVLEVSKAHSLIPRHPNCVIGESHIAAADALALLKTHYTGEVVELITSKGRRIAVTENHILLTEFGFLPARFMYEGLKVIDAISLDRRIAKAPDNQTDQPRVADLFAALSESGLMSSDRVPLASEDLHGDGRSCDSEIEIIRPYGKLRDKRSFAKAIEFTLPSLKSLGVKSFLPSFGSPTQDFIREVFAFDRSKGVCREILALLLGHLLETKLPRLAKASSLDAGIIKSLFNCTAATPELLRESINAHPILKHLADFSIGQLQDFLMSQHIGVESVSKVYAGVGQPSRNVALAETGSIGYFSGWHPRVVEFDTIIHVEFKHVTNFPVYDVQTRSTLYALNGIVSSNCRCAFIPANVGEDKTGQKRSKGEVEGAIDDSVRAEGPTKKPKTLEELKAKTKWPGADVTVPKTRPKSILEPPK